MLGAMGPVVLALRILPHPLFCLTFHEKEMYVDKGVFITPTVISLPKNGCTDRYAARLKHLIEYLDSPLQVPESLPASGGRPKRFAFAVIASGLAALFSTMNLGVGISNAVDVDRLSETVSYIQSNQEEISFKLNSMTETVLELTAEHHNSFLAINQKVELTQLQTDYNACLIGLNRLDLIIQAILDQSLTNHILPTTEIISFLKASPILKDSIYVRYPRLAYRLGKVELVNVDPGRNLFSVLIMLPHIAAVPDGMIYLPLYTPRFSPSDNGSLIESLPSLTPLFSPHGRFNGHDELLSLDTDRCTFFNMATICPLTSIFHAPSTTCTNHLLRNETDPDLLTTTCGIKEHSSALADLSLFDESPTSLLIFSNQRIVGTSKLGRSEILPGNGAPSCLLINKLQFSEVSIGSQKVRVNLRTDAFSLAPEEKEIVRHLHVHQDSPISSRLAAVRAAQLHPRSSHFWTSVLVAILITAISAAVVAAPFFITAWVRRLLLRRSTEYLEQKMEFAARGTVEAGPDPM